MSKLNLMLIGTCATAVTFALSACATPNTASTGEVAPTVSKTETSQVVEVEKELDPNRRVCKRQAIVGSNMKKRVCATAAVWEEEAARGRETAQKIQDGFRSQGGSN